MESLVEHIKHLLHKLTLDSMDVIKQLHKKKVFLTYVVSELHTHRAKF